MPVFGFGPAFDLIMFLFPFVGIWVLKRIACPKIDVASAGFIVIGLLCVLTQRIKYRYGAYHEGSVAVGLGLFYMVTGAMTLLTKNRTRSKQMGDDDDRDVPVDGTPK